MSDTNISPTFFLFEELSSTNTKMRELVIDSKLPSFSVVQASFQSMGRGQEGNHWESAKDENLLFSILIRPKQLLAHHQFYLSKAISIAIVESLNTLTSGFTIKWPNDVYHGDRKVAGILIENNLYRDRIDFSIVGIGLNINQTRFLSDAPNPVSVKQITGISHSVSDLLHNLTDAITCWIAKLNDNRKSEIDAHYWQHLYRSTGTHTFKDKDGYFDATMERIEPEGYLVLRDDQNQIRSYAFKEVAFVID